MLPLKPGGVMAVFGNSSYSMITGGTGSGDVNEAYSISLLQGFEDAGLAADPALAESYARYVAEQEAARPAPPMPFMLPPPIAERPPSEDEITRAAQTADAALVTIGRNSGEFADRQREADFDLSDVEKTLLRSVAQAFHARSKKVLVVLNIGGVIETASWRDEVDAILLAWQPGQESGYAIADVLIGRTPPSGKLATTFPVALEDVPSSQGFPGKTLLGPDPEARGPMAGDRAAEVVYEDDIWVGYRHFATRSVEPAYPFGFGLSYSTFDYSDLRLGGARFDGSISASVKVTNSGEAASREVVQLYVSAPGPDKPALELRDFAKTRTLGPGEAETLRFTLTARDLASFDEAAMAWVADAGAYSIRVGASSEDIRQEADFDLPAPITASSVSTNVGAKAE
jgi:beta-glucosidase